MDSKLTQAGSWSMSFLLYTVSQKKLDPFSFEHNFHKYCPILRFLSLLQTEIIHPQTHNWISHFTYSLLLQYLEKYNHIHLFTNLLNKSAMCAVISLWLQSRKFWWYLLLTSLLLLHDVTMTSYCCQQYAVSGNDFVPAVEQPAVVCQECTIADDVPSRAEDRTFRVVVRQWLGDCDCTAQYNCCLPATTDCRRFCRFVCFSFLFNFVRCPCNAFDVIVSP